MKTMWEKIKNIIPRKKRVKTPTVIQMEAVECGAAALSIILGYYGKIVPLEEMRILCGVSRDGSNAGSIIKVASQFGLIAKGYKKELKDFDALSYPVIVFWNFNHFLVVEGMSKNTVYLNDPGTGPRKVSLEEFDKAFTGIVLTFEPGEKFEKGGTKKSLFQRLKPRFAGSEFDLFYIMLASLMLTIPGLIIPIFSQIFVDNYLVNKMQTWILPLLIGMFITALFRAILSWLQQNQLLKLQSKLSLTTSAQFFWHVLRLPLGFYQQRYAGDITQRVKSNYAVAKLITGELATNAANIFSMIFYAILMFWYDVTLTIIGIIFAFLNFLVLRYVSQHRKNQSIKLLQDRGKLLGTTINGLSTIETIKATGGEKDFFARWSGYEAKLINSEQQVEVYTRFLSVVPSLLSGLMMVIILGVGGYQVMHGVMTIGMLVAFQSLMSSFSEPLSKLVGLGASLQNIEGDLTRLDDVLNAELDPLIKYSSDQKQEGTPKLAGFLELKNITFGYNRLAPPLIENFNLTLKPGSRVALVGSTGSGKSTVIRMITGINQPWSGEILFDGAQRDQIPRHKLVNSLSSVDQDIMLFNDTIRANLTLWDETRSDYDIVHAAKDADIHDIIMLRSKGYDFIMGEQGTNFSGGERQRFEIARALTINPTILIMDEATASLDPITEKKIDDNIRQRGCTCIIVAHRLSTIRDCDEIIVMNKGKIEQRGTHEELCRQGGLYTKLINLEESS